MRARDAGDDGTGRHVTGGHRAGRDDCVVTQVMWPET